MRKLLTTLACLCVLVAPGAYTARAQRLPPRNYEDRGACPFECCTYREWSVRADTVLYKGRAKNSPAAFRVRKGERVRGLTGVVVTLRPGRAVVIKATTLGHEEGKKLRVRPGDVLYLLHYEGEGVYKIWFRGKTYEYEMPHAPDGHYKGTPGGPMGEFIRKESDPETVWWVKVRNGRGQVGWTKQDEHFGDMDSCA
jgi:hypothetical protein